MSPASRCADVAGTARALVLATHTPPTRVLPGPQAAATCMIGPSVPRTRANVATDKANPANRNRPGHLLFPTVTSDFSSSDWLLIDVQTLGTGADPEKVIF